MFGATIRLNTAPVTGILNSAQVSLTITDSTVVNLSIIARVNPYRYPYPTLTPPSSVISPFGVLNTSLVKISMKIGANGVLYIRVDFIQVFFYLRWPDTCSAQFRCIFRDIRS